MIRYGFNVSNEIKFKEEEHFALENNFSVLQVWFDKDGLGLTENDTIHDIEKSKVKTILHISVAINDIYEVFELAIPVLDALKHKEVIVHIIDGAVKEKFHDRAKNEMSYWIPFLSEKGIKIYFENNSKLDNVLQTVDDIDDFFKTFPNAGFLIDVAHIDNYDHLNNLVRVKSPEYLHLSDRHLELIHEHLTIGDGNINFSRVFQEHLTNFDGTIIFEVPWTASSRKLSKDIIQSTVIGGKYKESFEEFEKNIT